MRPLKQTNLAPQTEQPRPQTQPLSPATTIRYLVTGLTIAIPDRVWPFIILRKVLKPAPIATFVGVIGSGILRVDYLSNLII
ncbi:MAG: hypothetical protein WC256_04355 [Desulfurivibrionaceae bacterium]|jgi:hypothetical protein